ncbi:ureidoglycolate lyase [Congregibacter litoralis]|uniref:Ureidoglycolate hydrolase n=1 Tax=Congregibacter litoralis KT71 TaxID=314285 RepID=A4A381_9GAMM|nr:ureidoglycolate lyase [Congregibacter litoralis]EAQ99154.1 Ureidoglycolate hydrolase [Congregibacter litoralis KT71]
MKELVLQPLSAEAFAPFGDLIDGDTPCEQYPINEGLTQRHNALARVDCAAQGGTPALSLFRAQAVTAGFVLRSMERHPLGSQAFVNTSGHPYAIVVAPPGPLDEEAIQGFLGTPHQSISYHRGTWHHYLLALEAPSDFVVVDRLGPGNNCDEVELRTPLKLVLTP